MRRLLLIAVVTLSIADGHSQRAAASSPLAPGAQKTDQGGARWIAKVNSVPISTAAFQREFTKITDRGAEIPEDRLARIKHNILQRLIEKELIRQAAKKARVTVSHAAVARGLAEYKKRFQTEAQFNNYLKHGRVTLKSIKDRIREKKRLENLLSSRGRLKVTKTEVREFYRANERFYVEKEGVEASHILVKLAEDAPRAEEKRAMKKIEKIQERLRRGSDFAAVAKKLSEGPSAAKGGDLGFFGRGQMVKPFEEAAFRLEVGAVSGPVRTRFGFHIIKVTDTREERKRPLAEVRDQIAQSLTNKKLFKERRKLLDALRQAATIKTKLPTPPSSDDAGVKEISEP